MSASETAVGVTPGYVHVEKLIEPAPGLTLGDTVLKWYDIAADDAPVPLAVRALARRNLRDASKSGELEISGDLGFVILHRCGESFYFLLVSTWRNENELWETVWAKAGDLDVVQPVAGRGDAPPDLLRMGARSGLSRATSVEPLPAVCTRHLVAACLPPRLLRRHRLRAQLGADGSSSVREARNPVGRPGEWNLRHRRGLDGERDEVFRLEVVHVRLAARTGERLGFERQHAEVVGDLAAAHDGIEPRRARRPASRSRPGRGPPGSRRRSRLRFRSPDTPRRTRGCCHPSPRARPSRWRRHRRRVRAPSRRQPRSGCRRRRSAAPSGASRALQGVGRDPRRRKRRNPDVLDEDVLGRGGAALHAVDDDDVRPGLHGELHVVVRPSRRPSRRSASPSR